MLLLTLFRHFEERKEHMNSYTHNLEERNNDFLATLPLRIHKMNFKDPDDYLFYLHWHHEFEFFVVTKGCLLLQIEDHIYQLKEGEGMFINVHTLHSAQSFHQQKCSFLAIVFYDTLLFSSNEQLLYNKYILPFKNNIYLKNQKLSKEIDWQRDILKSLQRIDSLFILENELLLKSEIFMIWNHLFEALFKEKNNLTYKNDERLQASITYIENNYMLDIDLELLAQMSHLSISQFTRLFKQRLHMTPIQYLMRLRILNSCQLLLETTKPIYEIASLSGFNNISYYNKTFHSLIGCTPSTYRKHSSYL